MTVNDFLNESDEDVVQELFGIGKYKKEKRFKNGYNESSFKKIFNDIIQQGNKLLSGKYKNIKKYVTVNGNDSFIDENFITNKKDIYQCIFYFEVKNTNYDDEYYDMYDKFGEFGEDLADYCDNKYGGSSKIGDSVLIYANDGKVTLKTNLYDNVKIDKKTGNIVESTNYTSKIDESVNKTDWIEKINELSIDEEVVDEFFKYKKMKIDPDFNRQEVIDFAYAEFDKLINGKYSDYDYAVIRDNDIKYRNKFLNNNKREYTCLYKINANMTGDTSTTVMTSTNGDTAIGTTASGISEYSQKILSIVNKIISEVNLKLFEKYGSFTKKGKIFNKDGYDVPYYYLDVLYWDEISLCVNRQKVKINKKTGEIVDK